MQFIKLLLAATVCLRLAGAAGAVEPDQNATRDLFPTEGAAGSAATADSRKSLAFSRIIIQMPDGQILGYAHDMYCGSGKGFQAITLTQGYRELPLGAYHQMFGAALTKAGYKTVGKSLLFGDATPEKPDLLVGAAVTSVEMKACQVFELGMLSPDYERRSRGGPGKYNTTVSQTIEWQVYDPLNKKIIFKATSQGHGKASGLYEDSQLQAMYGAFDEAAQAVLALPEFRQATERSEIEQTALASLSQAAAPVTSIPGVPLSSQPFQDRAKDIETHVVTVRSGPGHGSGFYIADGLLLTNHHVAAKGTSVRVRFLSGKEVAGLVIASHAARDVALIRTENVDLPGLPLQTLPPGVGKQVFVIGSPLDEKMEGTVSAGIVSAIREFRHQNFIQSDVMVTHGNSGGPMFDATGNVIGITDLGFKPDEVQGLNLFIPIAEALQSVGVVVQPPESPKLVAKVSTKKKAAP